MTLAEYTPPADVPLKYGDKTFPLIFEAGRETWDGHFIIKAHINVRGTTFGASYLIAPDTLPCEVNSREQAFVAAAAMTLVRGRDYEGENTPAQEEAYKSIVSQVALVEGRLPR